MKARLIELLLNTFSGFVSFWPERMIEVLARGLGNLWFYVLRYRRKVILENLRRAFPERSERERRVLARAACQHLVRTLFEFLRIPLYALSNFDRVEVRGLEHHERARAEGKGILYLTGHMGSFELGAAAAAAAFGAHRVWLVVKSFPPGVDRFVGGIRQAGGLGVIKASGAMKSILRSLRGGQSVVFVLDQHALPSMGMPVQFFGEAASTMVGLAVIAERTGAPVLGSTMFRRRDGTHVLEIHPPIPFERKSSHEETVRHMTQVYTRFIEERIREHPEQWLWTHRRWKLRALPESVSTPVSSAVDAGP